MKNILKKFSAGVLVAGVLVAAGTATTSLGAKPAGGCFRNILCLDVWQPVLCPNGIVYSNNCYAYRACQTNCVPWGGDAI